MSTNKQDFNLLTTALKPGINLLEASAGTGKTYAIAMLVLRFVVEQNYAIEQLLVVTFTKATSKELKQRVRTRLMDARQFLIGQPVAGLDANICVWAGQIGINRKLAIQRLSDALLKIDQAGIFTIHGFCQRLLKEYALESGQMFDVELSDETLAVRQQMAEDFWRVQIYPRHAWEVAVLCHQYATPDALLKSLGHYPATSAINPEPENLEGLLLALKTQAIVAHKALNQQEQALKIGVDSGYFKKQWTAHFLVTYQRLKQWLVAATESIECFSGCVLKQADFKLLTQQQLMSHIQVRHQDKLTFDSSAFDLLYAYSQKISLSLRLALAIELQNNLETHLQQLNIMSYDSLIMRTAKALVGADGELLIKTIKQQYRVALIDEFQDTDQNQWHIFSRLFTGAEQYLYLIGDPKQAIYKFRGADIYAYLQAKKQAQHHYTLGQNWRSHPHLVEAINQLFSLADHPFMFTGLEFNPVKPAMDATQGALMQAHQPLAPLVLWQLAESQRQNGYWSNGKAAEEIKIAVVNEILSLLQDKAVNLHSHHATQRVQASDIAILVRTHQQATLYQETLRQAGIVAVISGVDSVFASDEARKLYQLMQALGQATDVNLLKQALSLSWFALDGQQLYQMLNDEVQLGVWLGRFQHYHGLWQEKGFMAMMLDFLSTENIRINIAQTAQAERQITNLHHLLELVQQASLDEHLGLSKTIAWLQTAMTTENNVNDTQQLRLESDANAVKIVTLHGSKGLEYALVFCPYLYLRNQRLATEELMVTYHTEGEMQVDLGSDNFAQHREIALQEELAEDLRLLYVALTRAKYRCYVVWLDSRSKHQPNQSALAYLLYLQADISFVQQQAVLRQLSIDFPASFAYQLIQTGNAIQGFYQPSQQAINLSMPVQTRHLYSNWQMSSYTALSYLSQHKAVELPLDKADASNDAAQSTALPTLARGIQAGNVIHALLENISFTALAKQTDINQQRDAACQRYGLKVDTPEIINHLLYQTVSTALSTEDSDFYLANIPASACLKEMPFYLRLAELATEEINHILQDSPVFQPLTHQQMQGYLTGFIDLILLYRGRYYVLDYKSNSLRDYLPETLAQAMREHHYALQYWLYSVVLHHYLQQRLPGYQFTEHFGGVRYLFVRGMQAEQAMSGVYSDLPDKQRINRLSEIFMRGE